MDDSQKKEVSDPEKKQEHHRTAGVTKTIKHASKPEEKERPIDPSMGRSAKREIDMDEEREGQGEKKTTGKRVGQCMP